MNEAAQEEPTFHGFKRSDFGYDPKFDVPRTKELDIENMNPEEGILSEYQELFGEDGYIERSMYVDALGGNVPVGHSTSRSLLVAARRHMLGVKLPPKAATLAAFKAAQ